MERKKMKTASRDLIRHLGKDDVIGSRDVPISERFFAVTTVSCHANHRDAISVRTVSSMLWKGVMQ